MVPQGSASDPNDPLTRRRRVSVAPSAGNADGLFTGTLRVSGRDRASRARPRPCRETSRVPASGRQSQNVPVSYPREIQISPSQATLHAYLQGFCASPLTDSNRRPPPYHRSLRREARPGAGLTEVPQVSGVGRERVTTDGRACPRWCSLTVPLRLPSLRSASGLRTAPTPPLLRGRDELHRRNGHLTVNRSQAIDSGRGGGSARSVAGSKSKGTSVSAASSS